jgi:starch phosphorylase
MLRPDDAKIHSFRVVPDLPEPLRPLLEIAHNLWWSWHPEAVELFVRLDHELWEESGHNPVKLLGWIDQARLERAATDRSFLHSLGMVHSRMIQHLQRAGWYHQHASAIDADPDGDDRPFQAAYFSAEFGLHECVQIYSGGLGVLAGDHLKSASELAIPLVGVGLLYNHGYFHQYLNAEGYQQETYPANDWPNLPVHREIDPETGEQYRVSVQLPGRDVIIGVWICNVGRVPLYLLDTNLPDNSPQDRDITRNLYGGDVEMRIKQEIVLGIGGTRVLEKVGQTPTVYHINEGHSAFLALERIRRLREDHDVTFDEAREAAAASHVFTTHTPVPAGIDRFSPELMDSYFGHMIGPLGLNREGLLALGREDIFDKNEFFSMAVLALRTSRFHNGVSKLHGDVSRAMWKGMWPHVPESEVPIGHVTNGVHARTWISPEFVAMFDRYLGSDWQLDPADTDVWEAINEIPDEEFWSLHQQQCRELIAWVRQRHRTQLRNRGAGAQEIESAVSCLDPNVLTIGFARRFATYKRGTLLLRNKERLKALLSDPDRPIQILIAGKAHPADAAGKELIREIVRFGRQGGYCARIVFIEDYDMEVARRLVEGCDIWLNTPVRGMEASGTSGMKAALNGVINVSILDGWWDEAFHPDAGFAIGRGETYAGPEREMQDEIESRALYDLLERQIIPEFYDRDNANDLASPSAGVPRRWVQRMKNCIKRNAPVYNTNRMVAQYGEDCYFPAHNAAVRLAADDLADARSLAGQIDRYRAHWGAVRVDSVDTKVRPGICVPVREPLRVAAMVHLGELKPEEVTVQMYIGEVTGKGNLVDAEAMRMVHEESMPDGMHRFGGSFRSDTSGRRGVAVRVLPADDRLVTPFLPGLITWEGSTG